MQCIDTDKNNVVIETLAKHTAWRPPYLYLVVRRSSLLSSASAAVELKECNIHYIELSALITMTCTCRLADSRIQKLRVKIAKDYDAYCRMYSKLRHCVV